MTHIQPVPEIAVATVPPLAAPRQSASLEQLQPPAYRLIGPATVTFTETNGILGERPQLMRLIDILTEQWALSADQSQSWFWSSNWQAGEREASEDIVRGNLTHFDNDDDLLASI